MFPDHAIIDNILASGSVSLTPCQCFYSLAEQNLKRSISNGSQQ